MSNIFTDIKLDLFIQKHPRVLELKRKAKEIKKNKHQDLPLMTCQEIVSQLHGFHNWHHFLTLIKKSYAKNLDNIDISITQKPILDYDHLLIGHDINFNHYKWQNESSVRTHQLITGKNFYKQYEMFLINQLIEKNKSVYAFNKTIDETYEIINSSIKNKRDGDLSIIDFSNNFNSNKYSIKIKDDFFKIIPLSSLTNFLFDIFLIENNDKNTNGLALMLISIVSLILGYLNEVEKKEINFETIKKLMLLEELKSLYNNGNNTFPYHIASSLKSYLEIFQLFDEKTGLSRNDEFTSRHKFIYDDICNKLELLFQNTVFDKNGINLTDLFFKNSEKVIKVFVFDSDQYKNKIYQNFIFNFFKNSIVNSLSTPINSKLDSILIQNNQNIRNNYVFFNNMIPDRIGVLPAQARSLRISLFISFESVQDMTLKYSSEQVLSIIANTNTKITNDDNDKNFFIKNTYGEELNSSLPHSKNFLNTYNLQKNKDYFWLLHRGKEYQLSINF